MDARNRFLLLADIIVAGELLVSGSTPDTGPHDALPWQHMRFRAASSAHTIIQKAHTILGPHSTYASCGFVPHDLQPEDVAGTRV